MHALLAVLLWISPLAGLPAAWFYTLRSSKLPPPMRNALATGAAAASFVIVVMHAAALMRLWELMHDAGDPWNWRLPGLSLLAGIFAAAAGWACCILWLGLRCWLKGQWGSVRCPTGMMVACAWVVFLGLIVAYTEGIEALAAAKQATQATDTP